MCRSLNVPVVELKGVPVVELQGVPVLELKGLLVVELNGGVGTLRGLIDYV